MTLQETILSWLNCINPNTYIWNGAIELSEPHYLLSMRTSEHGVTTTEGVQEAILTIAYLGPNAIDKINLIATLCHYPSVINELYLLEINLIACGEVEEKFVKEKSFVEKASFQIRIATQ